jgi:hypothetical protein
MGRQRSAWRGQSERKGTFTPLISTIFPLAFTGLRKTGYPSGVESQGGTTEASGPALACQTLNKERCIMNNTFSLSNLLRSRLRVRNASIRLAGLLFLLAGSAGAAWAQGTAFTYQGRLGDQGHAANGSYDLRCTIYDAGTDGNLVAGPLTNSATGVTNGLFTVTLDFGSGVFTGPPRWLDIAIRTNGGRGDFTLLSPRRLLKAAPYTVMANSASNLLGTVTADKIASGAVGATQLADSAVGTAALAPSAVTSDKIADGTIVSADISPTGIDAGKIIGGDLQAARLKVGTAHTLSGTWATIAGGIGNAAQNDYATIGGGRTNAVSAPYGTVAGGYVNQATNSFATVGGGAFDAAGGTYSTVGGGWGNLASGWSATVAGGHANQATNSEATVGGGGNNAAGGAESAVGGGHQNVASGSYATVAGGFTNTASGAGSVVGGGGWDGTTLVGNCASGNASTVSGGCGNQATNGEATVSGGYGNTAGGTESTVGGGYENLASDWAATVAGGHLNQATHGYATVSGGVSNTAGADEAAVGGGSGNTASGSLAVVAGGQFNYATNIYATVGGGYLNTAGGYSSIVGGGYQNLAFDTCATVAGGERNQATNVFGTVSGGYWNTAGGYASTVGGGFENVASDYDATVAGGTYNQATNAESSVGGGHWNTAGGYNSTVGGGVCNGALGWAATVAGGANNVASGICSFAAGHRAKAQADGAFVWADSTDVDFVSSIANQFAVRAAGGVYIQSDRGVALNAANRPIITRGYDAFGPTAPAEKQGLGRWGMFMEPFNLVIGIPGDDVPGRSFQVGKYASDGSWVGLMLVDQTGYVQARVFNPTSDRAAKENFTPINTREVLAKVASLPLSQWNFKQDPSARHLGPVAQDFHAAFGLGTDDKHIATVDADGVALAAIQGLYQVVQEKEARIASLEQRLAELERRLNETK